MKRVKGTDKEDVRNAIRACSDLEWWVDLEDLDEHSVDAVAIGRYYLTEVI